MGIARPQALIHEYPYQLSGGMRQRVVIAMALSCNPELLIADEPTTALDVTVSAQILKLLKDLQESRHMSVMMINHNLGVIAQTCERVFVMYLGRIVEYARMEELFEHPVHPYTVDLFGSIPRLDMKRGAKLAHIRGYVPDPLNMPSGCAYHTRCRRAVKGLCDAYVPEMEETSPGHFAACHLAAPGRGGGGEGRTRYEGALRCPGRPDVLSDPQGRAAQACDGRRARRQRRVVPDPGGRDVGRGGRVRLRQEHAGQLP